jgi:serine/threonine protein kinase
MWREKYQLVAPAGEGGQGIAFRVTKPGEPDAYFLKELKHGHDSERRARFSREIACYRTLSHPGIPRYIDSNLEYFGDRDIPLYVVSEYIAGPTLIQRAQNERVSTVDALASVRRVVEILSYAHDRDARHRDLKPDNIIVRDGVWTDVVLVDWGMSYVGGDPGNHETETGQEIGNRFLRLPEHGAGAGSKREAVSDLTFAVGLLFYLLTGQAPRHLTDEHNRKPHERQTSRAGLAARGDLNLPMLLDFFDRGFEVAVAGRWQSAEEMLAAMAKVRAISPLTGNTVEAQLARLSSLMERQDELRLLNQREHLNTLGTMLRLAHGTLRNIAPNLEFPYGGPTIDPTKALTTMRLMVQPHNDRARAFESTWEARLVGTDAVFAIVSPFPQTVHRCPVTELTQNQPAVTEAVQKILLQGMVEILEGDGVNRRRYFYGEIFADYELALHQSQVLSRPLFLVVFDSKREDNSALQHRLGYFTEFAGTKEALEKHFVQAIVDVHKLPIRHFIPKEDRLEHCLMAVLTPNGDPLRVESVYANPSEGAKRVAQMIKQWEELGWRK